jgi:flavorubredoxin
VCVVHCPQNKFTVILFGWLHVPTSYTGIKPTQAHSFTNDYGRSMVKSYRNNKTLPILATLYQHTHYYCCFFYDHAECKRWYPQRMSTYDMMGM